MAHESRPRNSNVAGSLGPAPPDPGQRVLCGGGVGLPSGRARHSAKVERGGCTSEDEVELPMVSECAVPFSCGAQRAMLNSG